MVSQRKYDILKAMLIAQRKKNKYIPIKRRIREALEHPPTVREQHVFDIIEKTLAGTKFKFKPFYVDPVISYSGVHITHPSFPGKAIAFLAFYHHRNYAGDYALRLQLDLRPDQILHSYINGKGEYSQKQRESFFNEEDIPTALKALQKYIQDLKSKNKGRDKVFKKPTPAQLKQFAQYIIQALQNATSGQDDSKINKIDRAWRQKIYNAVNKDFNRKPLDIPNPFLFDAREIAEYLCGADFGQFGDYSMTQYEDSRWTEYMQEKTQREGTEDDQLQMETVIADYAKANNLDLFN